MTPEQQLHSLDLRQVERLQKLVIHIESDLQSWHSLIDLEAHLGKFETHLAVGLTKLPEGDNGHNPKDNPELVRQRKEILARAMKLAVFNCNNDLKQLHDQRKVVQARVDEVIEVLEAEEV